MASLGGPGRVQSPAVPDHDQHLHGAGHRLAVDGPRRGLELDRSRDGLHGHRILHRRIVLCAHDPDPPVRRQGHPAPRHLVRRGRTRGLRRHAQPRHVLRRRRTLRRRLSDDGADPGQPRADGPVPAEIVDPGPLFHLVIRPERGRPLHHHRSAAPVPQRLAPALDDRGGGGFGDRHGVRPGDRGTGLAGARRSRSGGQGRR